VRRKPAESEGAGAGVAAANREPPTMPSGSAAAGRKYDKLAAIYDRQWSKYVEATLRAVVECASPGGHEQILDLPCGTGELERLLLSRWAGLRIVGADLSRKMLRRARGKEIGPSVAWVQADAGCLPFPNECFDCVICVNSFHYFHLPQESLREFRRVLSQGAKLVLLDWCDDYLSCKLCSAWLRRTDPAFHQTYSLGACRAMVEASGFEVVRAERFRISWLWGLMRLVCRRTE